MKQVVFSERTVYTREKFLDILHSTKVFQHKFTSFLREILNSLPPLRCWTTAHIIGMTTICCNYGFHYFWLKIYCILNLLLAQLFPRRVYVVDKSAYGLSWGLTLLKGAIKSTSKVFPRIIYTLILHHAIWRIDGKAAKLTFIFTSELRNQSSITCVCYNSKSRNMEKLLNSYVISLKLRDSLKRYL